MTAGSQVVPVANSQAPDITVQIPDDGRESKESKPSNLAHLSWEQLCVTVKGKAGPKRILNDCSGYVAPGQLLAILGPSGCGKSTLLNTLAGRLTASAELHGQVRLNGRVSNLSYGTAAYVTQMDHLTGTLTVQETLWCVARLRLPKAMSKAAKLQLVDSIIQDMGLVDARHTYVGNWFITGLSGGQMRRLSLACELLTQPKLLFLDEPTSGLDAAAAFHVVRCLQKLAGLSCSIACSIHQPSSEVFLQFDHLCLLAGGQTVYFGETIGAADFFAGAGMPVPHLTNAGDHFLHCINKDFLVDAQANVDKLVAAYQGSPEHTHAQKVTTDWSNGQMQAYKAEKGGPSWMTHTLVLAHRNVLNNTRDVGIFWVRLVMYALLCIGLGFVFFQLDNSWKAVYSRASVLFFVVAFLTFMAIAAFPAFVEDMKVFAKERLNGYYGVGSFALANTLPSIPFIFLITVISTLCVYYLAGLNTDSDRVIYFILDLFISLLVTESLFMAVTPVLPHFLAGIAFGAGLMGLFMIVSGYFQLTSLLPKPVLRLPLHYMAFHTYAFFGFLHNEFDGVDNWQCPCSVEPGGCSDPACRFTSQEVLSFYDVDGLSKWLDLCILLAIGVFFRVWFVMTLKLRELIGRSRIRFFSFL